MPFQYEKAFLFYRTLITVCATMIASKTKAFTMKISTQFDAGAITVMAADNFENIRLRLRPDNASEFKQWFYFRLQGAGYEHCILTIEDASEAAYPEVGKNTKLWLLTTVSIGFVSQHAMKMVN